MTNTFDDSYGPISASLNSNVVPRMPKNLLDERIANPNRIGDRMNLEEILRAEQQWLDQYHTNPIINTMGADTRFPKETREAITSALEESRVLSRKVDEMLKPGAPALERRPPFGMQTAESLGIGTGVAAGYDADPLFANVFEMMMNNASALHTPMGIQMVNESARTITELWKRWATIVRPSFHIRNLIGGIWNGLYIGVGPQHYAKMTIPTLQFRKNLRMVETKGIRAGEIGGDAFETLLLRGIDDWAKPYLRRAWDEKVLQTSFARAEALYNPAKKASWNPLNPNMHIYRWGGRTMETFEDVMRMAAFYKWYDPASGIAGASFARQMVNTVHFDYTMLTPMEQKIKKWVPFYVWTRRNVPLQLSTLMQAPGFMMMYEHAKTNWNINMAPEDDPWNAYESESGWVLPYRRGSDDSFARLLWDPDLPILDLESLPLWSDRTGSLVPIGTSVFSGGQWAKFAFDMVGPGVSLPMQMMENADEGTVNAPAGFNAILRTLDPISPLWSTTPQGDVRIPRELETLRSTAMPWYDDYRAMIGVKPNNPYRAASEGWVKSDEEGFNPLTNIGLGLARTFGRGAGLRWYTPRDVFFTLREDQDFLQGERTDVRYMMEGEQGA